MLQPEENCSRKLDFDVAIKEVRWWETADSGQRWSCAIIHDYMPRRGHKIEGCV
jgi:hypothetical protein